MTSYLAGSTCPVQQLVIRGTTGFLRCPARIRTRAAVINLHLTSLSSVVSAHGLNLHQYADDCQLYLNVPVDDTPSAVRPTRLSQCIADVAEWLSARCLHLNPDKSVIMWLAARLETSRWEGHRLQHFSPAVIHDDCGYNPWHGVMLDNQLTMLTQVCTVCRSAYNYLRQLRPVVRALSVEARKTRICIFASRLLQLYVVCCYRQPSSTSSSCSKCCRTSCQWHSTPIPHYPWNLLTLFSRVMSELECFPLCLYCPSTVLFRRIRW